MAELINKIAMLVEGLILAVGYPGIFLVMILENIFPPMPSDPLIPFAGILVARDELSFIGVWIAAILGAIAGSLLLYAVGKWANEWAVRGIVRKYGRYLTISETELDRALDLFNRYGAPMVFFGRVIPVLRSVVSLAAGMSGMPLPKFLVFTTLSSAMVSGAWIAVGYVLGENWVVLLDLVELFEPLLIALSVMWVLFMIYVYIRRRAIRAALHQAGTPVKAQQTGD
jgi:membrane protein DedA with SNARE-associated domain